MININYLVHTVDCIFHLKSTNEWTVYEELLNQTAVRLLNDFDMLTIYFLPNIEPKIQIYYLKYSLVFFK